MRYRPIRRNNEFGRVYARGKSYVNQALVLYVLKTRGKDVYKRQGCTHAVQAAGHLVAGVLAAELAAGVQDGVDDGDGGQAGVGLDVHGLSLIHI